MKVYAIRNKKTGELMNPHFFHRSSTPKFYSKIRFANCAITSRYLDKNDYEIVEYELTNESVVE